MTAMGLDENHLLTSMMFLGYHSFDNHEVGFVGQSFINCHVFYYYRLLQHDRHKPYVDALMFEISQRKNNY